jgi:acyl-CoA thioester hydrolase
MEIRTKSFTLGYELRVNGQVYTTGSSVLVGYDSVTEKTIEIPAKMKIVLESLKRE